MKWVDIRSSRWYQRMRKITDYSRGPFGQAVCITCVATALFNVGTLLVYGYGHPLNRNSWRRMKKRGELSAEFLEKERIVNEYRWDRFNHPQHPYGLELSQSTYSIP